LKAVTGEDIIAAAKKVLNRKNAVTGWYSKPQIGGEISQ
jgi:hypothetical protein